MLLGFYNRFPHLYVKHLQGRSIKGAILNCAPFLNCQRPTVIASQAKTMNADWLLKMLGQGHDCSTKYLHQFGHINRGNFVTTIYFSDFLTISNRSIFAF